MSILDCPEGTLLVDNLTEAIRRQCELPAEANSPHEIALEMDTAEALQSAYRHASDHLLLCPLCRTAAPMPQIHQRSNRTPLSRQTLESHSTLN